MGPLRATAAALSVGGLVAACNAPIGTDGIELLDTAAGGSAGAGAHGTAGAAASAGGSAGSGASSSGGTSTGGAAATGGTGTGAAGGGGNGGGPLAPCDPIPNVDYGSLGTAGSPTTDPPPAQHPDLNVKVRGWSTTGGTLGLVDYAGGTDPSAPKLDTVFVSDHVPAFVQNYRVNDWDWGNMAPGGPITDWDVTMIAFASTPGEILELPDSGYNIGQDHDARVLFVDEDSMTLKYTADDNVVSGYTIHLVDICPEPSLKAKYEADDAAGRSELPVLQGNEPLGRARYTSFLVAIRDTGAFMDPRSQKDWW